MQTFNMQKVHKYLCLSLLSLITIVWLLEEFALKLVSGATHGLSAIALVILLAPPLRNSRTFNLKWLGCRAINSAIIIGIKAN